MEKQLLNLLNNENARKQYRYLLIDNLVSLSYFHILSIQSLKEELGKEAIHIIPRPDLTHDLDHCPKLVVIAKPDEQLNEKFVHFISKELQNDGSLQKRYICCCMVSENEPETLSKQIINIGLKLATLNKTRFVPFYEPFKLFLLQEGNKICFDWLPYLLNCCSTYCYTSFTNRLQIIQSLSSIQDPSELFINEEVKFYLKESTKLYHLTIAWQNICGMQNRHIQDSDILSLAECYRTAKIAGLKNTRDLFTLSLLLKEYPKLLEQKEVNEAVNESIEYPGTLDELLIQIEINN
ncbi:MULTISPECIES: hypothetical protein [unclassified Gilliamella]|uniref:hypothetical protein n=1 Tax=unclassified Gilliamella TaxID=2685620 RepID=UPI00226A962E|nr:MULTISPECIES: hypothetical protein [unclassified Gilliamella]MCX8574727.1 hypothetical protein [Gilliamella sp. B3831]MCX8576919.1 hypothetical protein [Gilliamella sp. B3815]MCX8590451.1 hypothetical protein [Gilliamella sp. B3812]MCX8604059.1 hypothetical protein [Gilliamella sp. B3823]MCX8605790.1 hypothetical protein [Gilliamella sp. B3825]